MLRLITALPNLSKDNHTLLECHTTYVVREETGLSYLFDRICSIFSGAGKFCLALGLGQLTRDVKSDVRTLNFRSDVTYALPRRTPNDIRRRSLCDVKCHI